MSLLRLHWNGYRYFPYERQLAVREAEAVFGAPATVLSHGLDIECSVNKFDEAERLTYFRVAECNERFIVPRQAQLEACGNGNCAARSHKTEQLPGPHLKRQVTRYSAHGLHEYRGKFNPQIVRAVGNSMGLKPESWVLDPFCGSGTTILEAAHIGWNAVGVDINPLGVLVANAKVSALKSSIATLSRERESLKAYLTTSQRETDWREYLPEVEYLEKWFPGSVLAQLSLILRAIDGVRPSALRKVFRVLLSDICRNVSFQDPGDLRIRRRKDAADNYPVMDVFLEAVDTKINSIIAAKGVVCPDRRLKQRALLGDSRNAMNEINNLLAKSGRGGFDGAITSPPYATAMPYIDTQRLSLVLLGLVTAKELRGKERALIGNREIQNRERLSIESELRANRAELPQEAIDFCHHLLDLADHKSHGFRRRNVPALAYKYLAEMGEMFVSVGRLVNRGGCYALLVGRNTTTLRGKEVVIDTPALLASVASSRGWSVEEMLPFEAYHRFDIHQKNSIREEVLMVLRNN